MFLGQTSRNAPPRGPLKFWCAVKSYLGVIQSVLNVVLLSLNRLYHIVILITSGKARKYFNLDIVHPFYAAPIQ